MYNSCMATTTRKRRSATFWRAMDRFAPPTLGHDQDPILIRPTNWRVILRTKGQPPLEGKLIELTEHEVRVLIPCELPKDSLFDFRIDNPQTGDALEARAHVTLALPPSPVADTWVIAGTFIDLAQEDRLRLGRWWQRYSRP